MSNSGSVSKSANALKFTKTTATISGLVEVSIGQSQTPGFYQLSVKDNGKGMTKEQVIRLFSPFEQADNSIQRQFGGTGLGLSITHKQVQMMGGEVECQSLSGVGSNFIVTLPITVEPDKKAIPYMFKSVKVAIVGDEDTFETDLKEQLVIHGIVCEIIPRSVFNAQLIDSQRFNYVIITAESFQRLSTEGKEVFIEESQCHYLLLDNHQDKLPDPDNVNISNLPLYPYYASKIITHIAKLEKLIEDENIEHADIERVNELPSIKEAETQHSLILVVEDNTYNQDLFKRQLAMLGYQSIVAENGEVALQLLERFSFALIITDCHMPIMDGYQFTKQRRQDEQ